MIRKQNQILIVDDDTDFAESLADLLELQGHAFAIATSGRSAIQIAQERQFDLAFLDFKMPGLNGIETLKRLQEVQGDMKVAVVTGYATTEQLDEAVDAGAFSVIEKPCSVEQLLVMANRAGCEEVVLVADDDPDFTEALEDMLSVTGRRILTANEADTAIAMLAQCRVNVLVLDLRLPDIDGHQVLEMLKERDIPVPVVVVTAFPFEEDDLEGFDDRVSDILTKPVPMRRLVDAINKAAQGAARNDDGRSR